MSLSQRTKDIMVVALADKTAGDEVNSAIDDAGGSSGDSVVEDSFVATFDTGVGAKTVLVRKIGKLVTLEIPTGSTADGEDAYLASALGDLPVAYRPVASLVFVVAVTSGGAPAFGKLLVQALGQLVFTPLTGDFPSGLSAGFSRCAVTYTLP